MSTTTLDSAMALVEHIQAIHLELQASKTKLEQALFETMQHLIEPGVIIDKRDLETIKAQPWFADAKTTHGNDRGSSRFRIDRLIGVELNILHPESSTWRAHATPISETTGKPMSGRTHGCTSAANITVKGSITKGFYGDLRGQAYTQACKAELVKLLEMAEQAKAKHAIECIALPEQVEPSAQ